MKVASVAEVKAHFSAYVKATEEGPVIVTRNGRPVTIMLPVKDDDELERLTLAYAPRLQAIIKEGRRQIRAGEYLPHDQFWREVEEETRAKAKAAKPRGKSAKAG